MALLSRGYHLHARLFTQVGGEARVDVTDSRATVHQELDLELPLVAVTHKPNITHKIINSTAKKWQRLLANARGAVIQCLNQMLDLTAFGGKVYTKHSNSD